MVPYEIRVIGDPVLKRVAQDVTDIDGALVKLTEDMIETMYAAPGAGLAAPQVGIEKRIFVYDLHDDTGPHVLLNAQIVESRGEWTFEEGCLSVPGLSWDIVRPDEVHVTGIDLDGNEVSIEASEYAGRVFQHELDHLNGVLLVERLDEDQRAQAKRAVREMLMARTAAPAQREPLVRLAGWHPRRGRASCTSARRRWPCPPLRALVDAGFEIALVVSRADRRRGRGGAVTPSPVKAAALELGLPVTDAVDDALQAGADLGVVVAFGRIIKPHVLAELPMVNLHFSLLPRWRGAAPVERALLAGDERTGVCVMDVEEGLDTGGTYACVEVPIGAEATAAELRAELVEVGTPLLVDTLVAGLGTPAPQVGEPTYAEKIDPAELEIDWSRPSAEIDRLVRLGGAWTTHDGRRAQGVAGRLRRRASPVAHRGRRRSRCSRCSPRARAAWRPPTGPGAPGSATAPGSVRDARPAGSRSTRWSASTPTGAYANLLLPQLLDAGRHGARATGPS